MDFLTSVWDGITDTTAEAGNWFSSLTGTANDIMQGVQNASDAYKKTTLNAAEAAEAEKTLQAQQQFARIAKYAALGLGVAAVAFILIKAVK